MVRICLAAALDSGSKELAEVHGDSLVGTSQAGGEVLKLLTSVLNTITKQLERNNTLLAVLGALSGAQDLDLVKGGCDFHGVLARYQKQVLNEEFANSVIFNEVLEGSVTLKTQLA